MTSFSFIYTSLYALPSSRVKSHIFKTIGEQLSGLLNRVCSMMCLKCQDHGLIPELDAVYTQ